jgi:hypothetical protein
MRETNKRKVVHHLLDVKYHQLLHILFFLKGNAVGEAPTAILDFFENKNPNSRLWGLEPGWLDCTSTSLAK